jgi:ribosomal protein S20
MANDAGDFALTSRAMLAQAEAALESGNAQAALATASQAQERFARGSQLESEWRAWLIAARANQRLGDTSKAQEQLAQGKSVLSRLAQKWGAEVFNSYTSRPDIQVYYKELG